MTGGADAVLLIVALLDDGEATVDKATLTFTPTGGCNGATGYFALTGTEIGRTTVTPEPAPLPLILLGIAGAGGFALWSRRRKV